MIPVVASEVNQLIEWKPILLFNRSIFGSTFVHSVVTRSPKNITSKSGKQLPLELWLDILGFATTTSEPDLYTLLQPHYLKKNDSGDKDLICRKIRKWNAFGYLRDDDELTAAEFYLAKPDKSFGKYPNPFGPHETRQYGPSVTIPVKVLACGIEFLYVKLTAPDVIKYLEGGDCRICRGGQTIGRGFCGHEIARRFLNQVVETEGEVLDMICPLCVGPKHAMDSLFIQANDRKPISLGGYRKWQTRRLQQLGFMVQPVTLRMSLPRRPRFEIM